MTPCAGPPVARAGGLFWRLSGPPQPRGEVGRGRGRPCGRRGVVGAPSRAGSPRTAARCAAKLSLHLWQPPTTAAVRPGSNHAPRLPAPVSGHGPRHSLPTRRHPRPRLQRRFQVRPARHAFLRGADVLTLELDGAAVLGALVIVPAALYVAVFGGIRVGSAFSMSTPSDSAPGGCSSAGPRRRFLRASLARGQPAERRRRGEGVTGWSDLAARSQMSSGSVLPAVTVDGKTSCSPTCSPTPNGEKRAGFPSTKHPQRLGLIDPQPVQNRSHVSACSRSCARADYDDVARQSGTDAIARAHPR